jgi:hypothetical protein
MLLVGLALTLAGCATAESNTAPTDESLLVAAGFHAQPTDTPARQKALAAMPPLKMVRRTKNGNVFYTFADSYNCRCLYVGSEDNYLQYRRLVAEQQTDRANREAAMAVSDEEMGWDPTTGLWSPEGPLGP